MPLVTAVRAVREVGGVKEGDAVLIHAGASGTGSMMVQVARALGARVTATVRTTAKRGSVEDLGAELVVAMEGGWIGAMREWLGGAGPDVVVDNLGGPSLATSVRLVRPLGTVVLMGNVLEIEAALLVRSVFFPQKRVAGTLMGGVEGLEWGLGQIRAGRIRPTLDGAHPLEEAAAAYERLARGEARGNLVFEMR